MALGIVLAGMLPAWCPCALTAERLGTAEITIRVHRDQITRKMKAQSLPDLVMMASKPGLL
jgi:FixJ family two-component response regulator